MSMTDPNRHLLLSALDKLAPLLDRLVFVGGCATGLLITDQGAAAVRVTRDVDVIVELMDPLFRAFADGNLQRANLAAPVRKSGDVDAVARVSSYPKFILLEEQLQALGFHQASQAGAPRCRWLHGDLILDIMPTDPSILGFANRWYEDAYKNAQTIPLGNHQIRLIRAPYFIATKLEAFLVRGKGDYAASRDLEDIVAVIDGRSELVGEVRLSNSDLQHYLSTKFRELIADRAFMDSIPGFLLPDAASQQRITVVLQRLNLLIGDR